MKPLRPARLRYSEQGVPFSRDYDDVYHAAQGAIAQSRHVFLHGNGLPERWRGQAGFTICETGFGLGTNFLSAWSAWCDDPQRSTRMHFLSIEAHPFHREDLAEWWLSRAPADWLPRIEALLAQWPVLTPGLHRLEFEGGRVTLTLAFGQAGNLASRLRAQVDAFFLDGFSPATNPDMWSVELFKTLSYLAMPGATAATWCAAGAVRRALQQVGFEVRKAPGFAGKQHMTTAIYAPSFTPRHGLRSRRPPVAREAVVVGGGIAAAGVAESLRQRGWDLTVVAPGVSTDEGHVAAAITPQIARDDNPRARLSRAAVLRARSRWSEWLGSPLLLPCGALHLAKTDEQAARFEAAVEALQCPIDWLSYQDANAASQQAGRPVARGGWWLPQAMRIRPDALIQAVLARTRRQYAEAWRVAAVDGGWRVLDVDGRTLAEAPVLVLATAWATPALLARSGLDASLAAPQFLDSRPVGGQVSLFPTTPDLDVRCIVAGDGYVLPPVEGRTVVGGTYVHDCEGFVANEAGHALNRQHLHALLPETAQSLGRLPLGAWSGFRHVLPGRLPLIAEHPAAPGLWVCAGYASRGMSWAALGGDILAAHLEIEPQLLESDLLDALTWR